MVELMTVFAQFGLAGLCIGYFVWRDSKREKADKEERDVTVKRIQDTEDWIRNSLMQAIEQNTAAFRDFAGAIRHMFKETDNEPVPR